jgi:hypothetical protein
LVGANSAAKAREPRAAAHGVLFIDPPKRNKHQLQFWHPNPATRRIVQKSHRDQENNFVVPNYAVRKPTSMRDFSSSSLASRWHTIGSKAEREGRTKMAAKAENDPESSAPSTLLPQSV